MSTYICLKKDLRTLYDAVKRFSIKNLFMFWCREKSSYYVYFVRWKGVVYNVVKIDGMWIKIDDRGKKTGRRVIKEETFIEKYNSHNCISVYFQI